METNIIINTSFPAFHYWKNAPICSAFLRNQHRHVFHVQIKIRVSHDDRDLEFIWFKEKIDEFLRENLQDKIFPFSCEQLCKKIQTWIKERFDVYVIYIRVMEDNENGAEIWFS